MAPLPLIIRLADDFDHFSPFGWFYEEPQVLDLLHWPHRLNHLSRAMQARDNAISHVGKDGFQVSMNVAQFKPSELNVKVVDDSIVVEGKHEEREDEHGFISRHFVRRYALPKGYDPEKVASTLSSDGVLTVSIPKPAAIDDKTKERHIQIQQTGPAHLNVKENKQDEKDKKEIKEKTPK